MASALCSAAVTSTPPVMGVSAVLSVSCGSVSASLTKVLAQS